MNLQTFKAATMVEALAQVKTAMGSDAVILHTRTYRRKLWLGLRRSNVVEITAGKGLHVMPRARRQASAQNAIHKTIPIPTATSEAGKQLLQTPAASNAVMIGLSQEMNAIKAMVKDLVSEHRSEKCPQIPEELFEHYQQLIESQVCRDLAGEIIRSLQKSIRPEHLGQAQFVREKLAELVERLLPTSGPIIRTKTTGPHVVALIGPTGVGKTTTIAKLAADLKLHKKQRVGLITIDTYRIAAIEQLTRYADIIGAPLRVVRSADDLKAAVESMSDCEYILIDTAGRSPNDTLKLNELKMYLQAAQPDEVHLVLSCTASQACAEMAIAKFEDVRVDKLIFTKLDEAAHVGVVLNVIKKVNKALSYVTTGQDVPDDIEVGQGKRLAQMILGSGL